MLGQRLCRICGCGVEAGDSGVGDFAHSSESFCRKLRHSDARARKHTRTRVVMVALDASHVVPGRCCRGAGLSMKRCEARQGGLDEAGEAGGEGGGGACLVWTQKSKCFPGGKARSFSI